MWPIYRRYHLLIVSQRDDDQSGALTTAVVDVLSRYLPSSRPQLVRAADFAAHRRAHRHRSARRRDHADRQRRGVVSRQAAVRRYPQRAVADHRLVRQPCVRLPAKLHGASRLSAGEDAGRTRGGASGARRRRRTASYRRIREPARSLPAKRCRMTERGRTAGSVATQPIAPKPQRRSGVALALSASSSLRPPARAQPAAHETIDTERANAILAATDAAATRVKSAAGSPSEAEALFALGMVQVEATATLNRDLAAHSGRAHLQRRVAAEGARSAQPGARASTMRSAATGCRRPRSSRRCVSRRRHRTPCERGSSFSKPASTRASCSIPSSLVGMSFDDLARQIAEAKALASVLPSP